MGLHSASGAKSIAIVIDDEFIIRTLASTVLEDLDFEIVEFARADDALSFIVKNHRAIGLIYTDIRMPGPMDGEALARRVATEYPHLNIIISSGHVRLIDRNLHPKTRFLPKPWSPEDLRLLACSFKG